MSSQTATVGSIPVGSSRPLRLDPLSLPVSFDAHDQRADGGVRHIDLYRERVVLRRALHGMRMSVNVRVSDFMGVVARDVEDGRMIMLAHRDPALSIPLCISQDPDDAEVALQMWSETFELPQLRSETVRGPAPRRRRHNAIRTRRPRFLMRRRVGALLNAPGVYAGEREIIAPE